MVVGGMHAIEVLGLLAGFLTTLSFLPQAVQIIRTKDTKSISVAMYSAFVAGVFLWMVYGLVIASVPVLLWNVLTLILSGTILFLKLRFG